MKWRPPPTIRTFESTRQDNATIPAVSGDVYVIPLLHRAISNYLEGKYCSEYCRFLAYEMWGIHVSYPHRSSAHLLFGDSVLHFTSDNCCTDLSYSDPELFNKISELLYKWSDLA